MLKTGYFLIKKLPKKNISNFNCFSVALCWHIRCHDRMSIWWSLDAKNTWFQAYVTKLWNWPFHLPHPHKKPGWDRLARPWPWQQVKTVSYVTREHTGTIKLKSPGGCNENALFWFGLTDYKANIAYFLVQEWQKPEYFVRFADFGSLFVTHGMERHKLIAGENGIDCNRVDELCARQEEADTRILLHASHAASNGHDCIAIKSSDTALAVLACTFSRSINANMLFCIDTKQRRRYLDMTAIGQSLGEDVCKALSGMHALTGWDSTSAFVGKGKRQSSSTQICALTWWWLVIRSATTTNGIKDVLGSYAHCMETSSVQTVLQQECTHLQFAANQICSQIPCRTSKLPGLHLAQFHGSGSSYAKSTWSWVGCDWRSHIHSLDGPAACAKDTLAIHKLQLPQRSLCRRQVFLPK